LDKTIVFSINTLREENTPWI